MCESAPRFAPALASVLTPVSPTPPVEKTTLTTNTAQTNPALVLVEAPHSEEAAGFSSGVLGG